MLCCFLQDYSVMYQVIERIRERLRVVPKLDVLSMPFRVSFVKVGTYRYRRTLPFINVA